MKNNIEQIAKINSSEVDADVVIINGEAFTYKSEGLTRRVFVNKDKTKVVKVNKEKNYDFNKEEFEEWQSASDEKRKELAHTELLPNGYIMQEYLYTLDETETLQIIGRFMTMDEIRFASSCRNDVGYDKDGNLKCFDLHEYKKY